jgi:adenylate kinase
MRLEHEGSCDMRVVLLGPPAAGKGTQARRITDRFGGVHIDTGDILRSNAERGTELGRRAQRHMERGELVPDEVVIDMVLERLGEADCAAGFVLDGFPRTVPQAEALDRRLGELDRPLEATVGLEVEEVELWRRLAERAREQDRADDEDEQAIRQRLELFARETGPLLDYYERRGLLLRIDAAGEIEQVTGRIAKALSAHTGRQAAP